MLSLDCDTFYYYNNNDAKTDNTKTNQVGV